MMLATTYNQKSFKKLKFILKLLNNSKSIEKHTYITGQINVPATVAPSRTS